MQNSIDEVSIDPFIPDFARNFFEYAHFNQIPFAPRYSQDKIDFRFADTFERDEKDDYNYLATVTLSIQGIDTPSACICDRWQQCKDPFFMPLIQSSKSGQTYFIEQQSKDKWLLMLDFWRVRGSRDAASSLSFAGIKQCK